MAQMACTRYLPNQMAVVVLAIEKSPQLMLMDSKTKITMTLLLTCAHRKQGRNTSRAMAFAIAMTPIKEPREWK